MEGVEIRDWTEGSGDIGGRGAERQERWRMRLRIVGGVREG